MEGLARVSKYAGGRPRLATVASDGRYIGLALRYRGAARPQAARLRVVVCIFEGGFSIHCHSADDLRATHARTLLPAALASVSFGFVLVRVSSIPSQDTDASCAGVYILAFVC